MRNYEHKVKFHTSNAPFKNMVRDQLRQVKKLKSVINGKIPGHLCPEKRTQ